MIYQDCVLMLGWLDNNTAMTLKFEIEAIISDELFDNGLAFMAVAFSDDTVMGSDTVLMCDQVLGANVYHNVDPPRKNSLIVEDLQEGFINMVGEIVASNDGHTLNCVMER